MKRKIIIVAFVMLPTLILSAQPWIGARFKLDTIVEFKSGYYPQNLNLVKTKVYDSTFYFVEQLAHSGDKSYSVIIHGISLSDYLQKEIEIKIPYETKKHEKRSRDLWIYDFDFSGEYLLITTQNELFLYKKSNDQSYALQSRHKHKNLYMSYYYDGSIYFFEEDHDKGFKWFRYDIESDSVSLVRELIYEAPHIVQIQPNRYIFHNPQTVFFLSTRKPQLEEYSKSGEYFRTINFNISQWKEFEDEYIKKTLTYPYGVERIYAVKNDLFSYSYPKVVFPICDDYVLFFTHYDSLIGKSELRYAINNKKGETKMFSKNNHEDNLYVAARFPFDLFYGSFDKGNASNGDYLVQLTYTSKVSWEGKSVKQYNEELNDYFSTNEPTLAYKIMRYIPEEPSKDGKNEEGDFKNLYQKRTIHIIHGDMECFKCVKTIFNILNGLYCDNVSIKNVYKNKISNLKKRELEYQLSQHLLQPFEICSTEDMGCSDHLKGKNISDFDYPCVVLEGENGQISIFKLSDMFTSDVRLSEMKIEFVEIMKGFVSRE